MISLGHFLRHPIFPAISSHSDKVFARVCRIIKDRFADPDFGPAEVAAEAGISLRHVQKLFTLRDSACGHFIYAVRLDHAARLIKQRALTKTEQPLSVIAYASGFRDYTHFARAFRQRFGHPPGAIADRMWTPRGVRAYAEDSAR
jgi:AraC family transcriptional regulator, positive regulator of tynA and feaB